MTDKEKAKAYDEALERAKKYLGDCMLTRQEYVEKVFPEFAESEGERIRKALIRFHKSTIDVDGIKGDDILAWLEKQGNSKPIDKLQLSEELYEHIRNTCACIDDALSSETLADIKDYLSMAEHSAQSAFDMIEKQDEQKSAVWSDEDETGLTNIIIMLKEGASLHFNKKDIKKAIDFLKSLRPQKQWKPSAEHIVALNNAILLNEDHCNGVVLSTLRDQLYKLMEE